MKARFIKPALFVLLGIFIGMYFPRCGNDAGIGSDFDATKYYTKDEIDQMMDDYLTQSDIDTMMADYYTQLETDILLNQYYSETDIDSMLTQYYQQSEVDNLISKNKSSILGFIYEVGFGSGGGPYYWQPFKGVLSAEELAALMAPTNGTLTNLCVKSVSGGPLPTGRTAEIVLRVNYTDTPLTLEYTEADGTSLKINTSSVPVVTGDVIVVETTATVGTGYAQFLSVSYLFDAEE
jgi:hypothetical protein